MAGSIFQVGETKVRPGVYVRVTNIGEPPEAIVPQGIVAALFRASWGPLGEVVYLENADAVISAFGSAGTVDTALEAFRGGCRRVVAKAIFHCLPMWRHWPARRWTAFGKPWAC